MSSFWWNDLNCNNRQLQKTSKLFKTVSECLKGLELWAKNKSTRYLCLSYTWFHQYLLKRAEPGKKHVMSEKKGCGTSKKRSQSRLLRGKQTGWTMWGRVSAAIMSNAAGNMNKKFTEIPSSAQENIRQHLTLKIMNKVRRSQTSSMICAFLNIFNPYLINILKKGKLVFYKWFYLLVKWIL